MPLGFGMVFELYDLLFTAYVAPSLVKSGILTAKTVGLFGASGLRLSGPLNPFPDQLSRLFRVAPANDLDPLAGLEILVVGEEVLDLVAA